VFLRNVPLGVGAAVAVTPLASLFIDGPGAISLGCLWVVAVIFTKRLLGNPGARAEGVPLREVLLYRLLFDRDVRNRDEWVRKGLDRD